MQQMTGREHVDAVAMQIQVIEATGSLNLLAIMTPTSKHLWPT